MSSHTYLILQEDSEVLSHLLEALEFGAPPHGGIALGKCSIALQVAGALWLFFLGGGGAGCGVCAY